MSHSPDLRELKHNEMVEHMKEIEPDHKKLREMTVEIARKLVTLYPELQEWVESRVPEIKESEDERLKRELIQYLKDYSILPCGHYSRADFFAWIEKQGEQRKIEQKTWSEEDERTVTGISMVLQSWDSYHVSSAGLPSLIPQYFSWLNSIKDRLASTNKNDFDKGYEVGMSAAKFNQWKPTEEQMEVLNDASRFASDPYSQVLKSLYEDLEKLQQQ